MKPRCIHCGLEFDGAYSPGDEAAVPGDGDLSVCFHCGGLMMHTVRDGVLGFRPLTDEEIQTVIADEYVMAILAQRAKVMHGW